MEIFSALLAICAGNSPVTVNSPHKGQWRGALMFSFICAWIKGWVNNRETGDLRRHHANYDVIVMETEAWWSGIGWNIDGTHNYCVKTTFWRNNYVFITLCVWWDAGGHNCYKTMLSAKSYKNDTVHSEGMAESQVNNAILNPLWIGTVCSPFHHFTFLYNGRLNRGNSSTIAWRNA